MAQANGLSLQVAARYQPQQYLIGPAVFPTYWFVLRIAFFWSLVIYLIVSGVRILVGETPNWTPVLEAALNVPGVLMTTAAWVTLVFAAIEFVANQSPTKYPEIAGHFNWSPSTLPPVEKEPGTGKKPRSFAQAVTEVVFDFLFLVWLLLIPRYPFLLMGPGVAYLHASPFQLAYVWVWFFWWVVALNLLQLGWRSIELARGSWQHSRRIPQITTKLLGLIPLMLLLNLRDQAYITLKHPGMDGVRYGGTLDSINHAIYRALFFVCVITVLQLVWELGKVGRDIYRKRAAAGD